MYNNITYLVSITEIKHKFQVIKHLIIREQ